jgi:hypothetical protein
MIAQASNFPISDAIKEFFHRTFPAHSWGNGGWLYIIGSLLLSIVIIFLLTKLKPRARKTLIVTVTFLCGLFFVLEFFWPVRVIEGTEKNAFTEFLQPVTDFNLIVATMALGLGIYSLSAIHGKTLSRVRTGWFYSLVFFLSMIVMASIGILYATPGHDTIQINENLHNILYRGGLQSLDATMFSIIAFYITSAAYRAFRVRSAEATLMMGAAFIVMLGQVYAGQVLTSWLPAEGFAANFRVENWSDWILTRVNAPAVRAVGFGLGVGLLATALRIWLSLERGSYFDREV